MSNEASAVNDSTAPSGAHFEKTANAGPSGAPADATIIDMSATTTEKQGEAPAGDSAAQQPAVETPKDTCEQQVNMFWLVLQWISITLMCASIATAVSDVAYNNTMYRPKNDDFGHRPPFEVYAATFVNDILPKFINVVLLFGNFSNFLGLKHWIIKASIYFSKPNRLSDSADEMIYNNEPVYVNEEHQSQTAKTSFRLSWPDYGLFVATGMFFTVLFMLGLVAGRKRYMRGKVFAFFFLLAQFPVMSIFVDLWRNHKQGLLDTNLRIIASPEYLTALYGTSCALQSFVALCAFLGLMLNGTRAAGYLTSFYHVRKPASTA